MGLPSNSFLFGKLGPQHVGWPCLPLAGGRGVGGYAMCVHGSPLVPLPPSVPHWVISVLGQTAGSHLPDLTRAQEVRREAASALWRDLTGFPQPGDFLGFWRGKGRPQRQAGGDLRQASPELGSPTGNRSRNLPCFSVRCQEYHLKSN